MFPSLTFSLERLRFILSAVAVVCLLSAAAHAQKIDQAKLDVAVRRSGKAVKVLTDVSALPPGEAIPRELIEKARAIAVFPDTDKANLLVQKFMKGYGIMSRRVPGGWSTPAFYGFVVSDRGWTRVKAVEAGIIMLFMDDNILKRFEKDGISKFVAEAGPVGELTRQKELRLLGASIIVYSLSDGKLHGVRVEDDETTQNGINSDNNINKAVYGLKAREVLSGKTPVATTIPPSIIEFQNVLTNLSKQ